MAIRAKDIFVVSGISCDNHDSFCRDNGVSRGREIRFFKGDGTQRSARLQVGSTLSYYLKNINLQMHSYVREISSRDWPSLRSEAESEKKHIFLLFSNKKGISSLIKSVSLVTLKITQGL